MGAAVWVVSPGIITVSSEGAALTGSAVYGPAVGGGGVRADATKGALFGFEAPQRKPTKVDSVLTFLHQLKESFSLHERIITYKRMKMSFFFNKCAT